MSCFYNQDKTNGNKITHEGSPNIYPLLGIFLPYLSQNQVNSNFHKLHHWCIKIFPWVHTSNGFFVFGVEIIREFTLTFVDICYDTSYPFGFTYRNKNPPLEILKFLVTTLRNQDKKVALVQVDEDVALIIYSELMRTCHNMNIVVQTTGGYVYSINGKPERPHNTLAIIKKALLINSSHKRKLWCFNYQYNICLSCHTEDRLRDDVTYYLWNGLRPSYKHIKICGERGYIINGVVQRKKFDDISHFGHLMKYAANTEVIIYLKPDHNFSIHRSHHDWFMNMILIFPWKTITLLVVYPFSNILKLFFIIRTCSI